ncbi:hypothetical protein ER308_12335 [Egibacter rhizosphaerae]|uniref:Nucleotidyltransferase family protein n=1 Tax=Egibacter rhizosphaerae TaxID=1670831 RepID=A0A411YGI1_9ACTN|nr:nucleotidyltransferase family protein [Egibacter rhizosphaerae]QBI20277.1 hypothetical protein ER308_12335 [Egibacter rhizosphaerae]
MALNRTIARLLRASVARPGVGPSIDDVLTFASPAELEGLAEAAFFHGVGGYVYRAVGDRDELPHLERERLKLTMDRTVVTHLRALSDLRTVMTAFEQASIPWLAIKGPVLGEPVHGRVDLRAYGDLDLVVPGAGLGDALDTLEAHGAEVRDRNWTLIRDSLKGEVHVRLPSGLTGDVHWHLINDNAVRKQFRVPMADLFSRMRTVPVGGIEVPTLGAADTIVYVAMHAVMSGGHRLVWLKDLERLLENPLASATEIGETARRWRAGLVLATALQRVDRSIGCPPAARTLRTRGVGPRMWLRLSSAAFAAAPAEAEDGGPSWGRLLSRATRGSGTASGAELARKAVAHWRGRSEAEDEAPTARLPVDHPGSDRYESGGAAAQEAFLRRVAQHSMESEPQKAISTADR